MNTALLILLIVNLCLDVILLFIDFKGMKRTKIMVQEAEDTLKRREAKRIKTEQKKTQEVQKDA